MKPTPIEVATAGLASILIYAALYWSYYTWTHYTVAMLSVAALTLAYIAAWIVWRASSWRLRWKDWKRGWGR